MRLRISSSRHHGGVAIEAAVILPVAFYLLLTLVVGGMGVFRYQEMAALAREAARYGATHGGLYRKNNNLSVGTAATWRTDIYDNAISPRMVSLDTNAFSYTITWPDVSTMPGVPDNWPGSTITVTVSYTWHPEIYLGGPVTLTSTSAMRIEN